MEDYYREEMLRILDKMLFFHHKESFVLCDCFFVASFFLINLISSSLLE